jgi:uncharacterized membrane protein YsdA (DUF1294 family)
VFGVALLVAPALALQRLSLWVHGPTLYAAAAGLSVAVFLLTWLDKRRAEAGGRRIPESVLHLGELLGGWPGGGLAQRLFRHKISKWSYQAVFWLIVAAHQLAAVDYLRGGQVTRDLWQVIRLQFGAGS